jgi:hypothetical protein
MLSDYALARLGGPANPTYSALSVLSIGMII